MPPRSFVQGAAVAAALVLCVAPSRAERSASFVDDTGADADTVEAGTLGPVTVGGDMTDTVLGAGLASVDDVFGNGDDGVFGGDASRMGAVTIGESFNTSFFGAGRFGPVRIDGQLVRRADSSSFVTRPLQ